MENIVFVIAVTIIGSSWSESPNVDPSAEHRDRALAKEAREIKKARKIASSKKTLAGTFSNLEFF